MASFKISWIEHGYISYNEKNLSTDWMEWKDKQM